MIGNILFQFYQLRHIIVTSGMNKESRGISNVFKAAMTASVITTVLTNPLDVAKLNMQYFPLSCPYYPHQSYRQMFACSCTKFSFEGSIRSLRYAIPQSLVGNMMFMQLYEPLRAALSPYSCAGQIDSAVLGSSIARAIITTINIPLQAVRVKLSNRVKGGRVSFEGYRVTMVHDVAFSALFWASFEASRNLINRGDYRQTARQTQQLTPKTFAVNMLPGFICGSVTSVLTTPLDTLKTRIQSQGMKEYSILGGLKQIHMREGWVGLFSGVEWRILRSGSVNAIYQLVYQQVMKRVSHRGQETFQSI